MKKKKTIYCERCHGEITSKDDLVITNSFYYIVAYHERCFSKDLKRMSSFHIGNSPINGTAGNTSTVIALIIGIIALFIKEIRYISFLLLLYVGIRIYAWFKYERYLS